MMMLSHEVAKCMPCVILGQDRDLERICGGVRRQYGDENCDKECIVNLRSVGGPNMVQKHHVNDKD